MEEPIGQRASTVYRSNLSAIVRQLHLKGPKSRMELVTATGLTRVAIADLVDDLVELGLVRMDDPVARKRPGRPSPVVSADPQAAQVLAVEIAVDSIGAAVIGLGGIVQTVVCVERRRDTSVEDTVAEVARLAESVLGRPPGHVPLIGIGVAVPGLTRQADGLVMLAPNLGWHDVPLATLLATAMGDQPRITVANGAQTAALAEYKRGAAVEARNVLFISAEVGVGGGLVVDGLLWFGASGYGGEVGHMLVNPNGRTCQCGNVGCWETEIGEGALLRRAGLDPNGGRPAMEQLWIAVDAQEPVALAAIAEVRHWLAIGIASLLNVVNPEMVVLAGFLERLYPMVIDGIRETISQSALAPARSAVDIVPSTLGAGGTLQGAAELAFEPLLADPARWNELARRASATDAPTRGYAEAARAPRGL